MQLADLDILQNVTPKWGAGHYLARHQNGDLLEVLVAERSSESVTSLLSWAHALERVSHPSIPDIQTIVHQEITFVALKVNDGLSLSHPIQNDRDQLNRLDILSAFYQLATALKKLHDHGLNHGNLTLDHMKFVGEGHLQLRGWAPPAIETTFSLRQLDELKRFKNFFYLAMVGQFPPAHRNKHSRTEQKLTPFQVQCLEAWGQWYHEEAKKPKPNLSTSRLMLFDEPPQDAQELIDELTPYLDHSIAIFYDSIAKELERRESFEALYVKRMHLLSELERTHRATELWLQQQEHNKMLSDKQSQQIEKMFGDLDQLQGRLERLGGYVFQQAHKFLDQSPRLQSRGAHTQLYDLDLPIEDDQPDVIQTLGGSLKTLDEEWAYVNPDQPIYISQNDQQLIPSQAFIHQESGQLSADRLNLNHGINGGLIEWADLPPLVLDNSMSESSKNTWRPTSSSNVNMSSSQFSALGLEPLPSQVDIPHAIDREPDRQATQLYMPQNHDYSLLDVGIEQSEGNLSILGLSALVPGKTRTAFTEHLSEFDGAEFYQPHNESGPKLAFSHRNFFAFLYATAALVFIWSLRDQGDAPKTPRDVPSVPISTTAKKAGINTPFKVSSSTKDIIDPPQTQNNKVKTEQSEKVKTSMMTPPTPPPDMVFIPGGMVNDTLSDEAYNRMVTHCMFEPNFAGRDRRKKESCKRLIRKSRSEPKKSMVRPFFMDIYEVSRDNYQQYCRDGGVCDQRVHYSNAELVLPVVQISMIQAMDYCRFYKKTLPSYEQWLFSARGESNALYPWGNGSVLDGREYRANYKSKLSKAKRRRRRREIDGYRGVYGIRENTERGKSPFGVAHLAGNVREWVSRDRRKLGWVTGGSWKQPLWSLRLTSGEFLDQYVDSSDDIGFRCAKEIEE
jgi:formylglycine-generating enzyme required for sulfatase activity